MNEERTLGRFRLLRQLGAGGLASVHLARLEGTAGFHREVAVKLLHPHLKQSRALVDLFLQEARTTSTLHHPNIAQVYELGEQDNQLFMVMEYIEGLDLRQLLEKLSARGEQLGTELSLCITMEVAKALQHAHAVLPGRARRHPPVVHRDLSPGNVMVSVDGAVKLLDFGVAKTLVGDAAADQVARGKWPYMSPEQVRGEPLDARSDLFSLGSLLYEVLTGRQAFAGRTVVDSMRRVERADLPPAPGLEPGVQAILDQLLSRRREDRFPNAGAALEAIGKVLLQRGFTAPDRRLAELLDRLVEPEDDGFSDDEATGVLPPRVVAKMMQEQLAPRGRAPTLSTPPTPLPSPRSPITPVKPPATGSGDEDQVTLPPSDPSPPRASAAAARAPVEDDSLEEPTVVSFDGPQRLVENVALPPNEAEAFDEAPCVQPAQAAPPATAPEAAGPAPGVVTPWTLPPQAQTGTAAPPPSSSEDEGGGLPWPPEPAAAPAPQRPRGSRNLLVLTLALLAVLIAGLAVLLAVKQRRESRREGSSPPSQVAKADPAPLRDAAPSKAPDAGTPRPVAPGEQAGRPGFPDAGPGRPAAPDAGPGRPAAPDAGPGRPAAPDAGPGRPAAPDASNPPTGTAGGGEQPPRGRRPQGAPRKGELDVHSQPSGAWVLVDGQRKGKTPLRLDVAPGRKVQVALSQTGRALYRTPVWIPPGTGRRLDVILPFVPKIIYVAKPGRTALRVLCEGEGPNRVYLDALDTGFDCPTPPLAVLPVAHSVSVYFARTQRTHWKQFRPKAGQVNEVTLKE